jgi:diguanylate cyclase
MEQLKVIASLTEAVALMALLAIAFGTLERLDMPRWRRSALIGAVFGLGAVIAMLAPTQLGSGGQIDGRSIVVGLGAAFGGVPAAVVSAAIAGCFRYFVVGGGSALVGTIGIALAAILGLAWMRICTCNGRPNPAQLALAGVMISFQAVVVVMLPYERAVAFIMNFYPLLLIASVVGAMVLGSLISRERHILDSRDEWRQMAEIDQLTGLRNRRHMEFAFEKLTNQQLMTDTEHAIILLDIDHFKRINDEYGHAAGDEALKAFARTLQDNTRSDDIVARMGGEEFCILLKDTPRSMAEMVAQRILKSVRNAPIQLGDATIKMTVSGGVTAFQSIDANYPNLMAQADSALYQAKEAGRDRILSSSTLVAA